MSGRDRFKTVIAVFRLVLGVVFVFSGLTKSIDPWGTALKVEEYLTAFGMESMVGLSGVAAVVQSSVEFVLGLMLLCGIGLRLAAGVTVIFMIFFTALTLVIAIWNPVDDCGCFGEALRLSNWMTFAKNAVLLPLSIAVWRNAKGRRLFQFSRRDTLWTAAIVAAAVGLNLYSWYNLPPVDAFSYKKGADLRTDVLCTSCIRHSLVLVYEDVHTGEVREFDIADTTWYDTSRWRYVDTRTGYDNLPERAQEYDFALWRNGADRAEEIVYAEGVTYMITVRDGTKLSRRCKAKIEEFVLSAGQHERIIYVAGTDDGAAVGPDIELGGRCVPMYGMDRRLMSQLLRSDAGVVVIEDGIITEKLSCRGLGRVRRIRDAQMQMNEDLKISVAL